MKIKSDLLRIRTLPYDDKGNKVEPEQQPVHRVITTEAPMSPTGGAAVGTIPTEIVMESTVAEVAGSVRTPCFSCRNFDQNAWAKLKARAEDPTGPKENREVLNSIRAHLLETNNASIADAHAGQDGDFDVEHALASLGVCRPLTEMNQDPVIVYPSATCPVEVCTPDRPKGFYKAKDRAHAKLGDSVFDRVMQRAMGKLP